MSTLVLIPHLLVQPIGIFTVTKNARDEEHDKKQEKKTRNNKHRENCL